MASLLLQQDLFDHSPGHLSLLRHRWEASVSALRARATPAQLRRHWVPTGFPTIDQRARAHVAEWLSSHQRPGDPPSAWDLYVVEGVDGTAAFVRGLRLHEGLRVDWFEDDALPTPGTVVGLRLQFQEEADLWATTLPLEFGTPSQSADVMLAILRAFGAARTTSWQAFMGRQGARILLEYALTGYQELSPPSLDNAFADLEDRFFAGDLLPETILPFDRGIALVEDGAGGPLLTLFEDAPSLRRYHYSARATDHLPTTSTGGARLLRLHRIDADIADDHHLQAALDAGLDPFETGVLQVECRAADGRHLDPAAEDLRRAYSALRALSSPRPSPAWNPSDARRS
jgi:hypothetical protein